VRETLIRDLTGCILAPRRTRWDDDDDGCVRAFVGVRGGLRRPRLHSPHPDCRSQQEEENPALYHVLLCSFVRPTAATWTPPSSVDADADGSEATTTTRRPGPRVSRGTQRGGHSGGLP
jgi:hypothetical protein